MSNSGLSHSAAKVWRRARKSAACAWSIPRAAKSITGVARKVTITCASSGRFEGCSVKVICPLRYRPVTLVNMAVLLPSLTQWVNRIVAEETAECKWYDRGAPNGLRVSRRLEGITLIDRQGIIIASRYQNRPDPAGRLHTLVGRRTQAGVFVRFLSVMIARLNEIDSVVTYHVDQPMLLGNASRPDICTQVPQRFGFAHTAERITHDGFQQGQYP